MRVAFPLIDRATWTGGYNYLLNLFRVLHRFAPDRVTPVLFHGPDASAADLHPFVDMHGQECVVSRLFDTSLRTQRARRGGLALLRGRDAAAEALFRRHEVDVAFESGGYYGWRFPIPAVAWVPDLQHRHRRDMFGARAYWQREIGYRALTLGDRVVMVSSHDARRDCERFYPRMRGRIHVVPFSVHVDEIARAESADELRARYGLPSRFYFLPNQIWKHKNHRVVIEAVAHLKAKGTSVCVAISGQGHDHRHASLYDELRARVDAAGIDREVRFLGLVPHADVLGLIRASTALINPSFCEGWSTTVEEAKALGVPMILSDLVVHREQAGRRAVYFDPQSPAGLAEHLARGLEGTIPDPLARQEAAAQEGERRLAEFAAAFVEVVGSARAGPMPQSESSALGT